MPKGRKETQIQVSRTASEVVWRLGDEEARFPIDELPDGIKRAVLSWGLNALLQSRTSSIRDDAERMKAAQLTFESLKQGMWRRPRPNVRRFSRILVAALCELKGWSRDEAIEFLAGLTPEQREVLPYHPKLAPIYARLRAESKGVDSEEVEL